MTDPSSPSATAGTTANPTPTVSVVVIDELITSVITIGHRPKSTERGANTACKGLCASVRTRAVQSKGHLFAHGSHPGVPLHRVMHGDVGQRSVYATSDGMSHESASLRAAT